ncbi:MAG: hypothetical protein AB1451_16380 [Nitrospirota bacterium]
MQTRTSLLGILLLAPWSATAYGSHPVEPYLQEKDPSSHRSLTATVTRVESGMVFLRTAEGTTRSLAVAEAKRDGMSSLKPGDEVDLILDKGNSILAVAPPRGTGAYIGDVITGTVQHSAPPFFDRFNKEITLKTEEGEIQTFELRNAVATKLNGVSTGKKVILEMDGHHRAFDAYRTSDTDHLPGGRTARGDPG